MFANVTNLFDLSKLAVKEIKAYEVREEYGPFINTLRGLRVALAVISIFSGFCWFQVKFSAFLSNVFICSTLSLVCLSLLELVNKYLQGKLFKFLLKPKRRKEALSMLAILAVFYFFSFHVSTQGISLYFEDVTKETTLSNSAFKGEAERVAQDYERQISDLKEAKSRVTPPAWNNGAYTTQQNKILREYDDNIMSLEKEKKQALKDLEAEREAQEAQITNKGKASAQDYYFIVCALMGSQLFVNFLISFFLNKIYTRENGKDSKEEEAEAISSAIGARVNNLVVENISSNLSYMLGGLERAFLNLRSLREENEREEAEKRALSPITAEDVSAEDLQASENEAREKREEETPEEAEREAQEKPERETFQRADLLNTCQAFNSSNVKIRGFAGFFEDQEAKNQEPKRKEEPQALEPNIYESRIYETKEEADKTKENALKYGFAVCPMCGKRFIKNHKVHTYCVPQCRYQHHANEHGKPYKFEGVWYYPQEQKETSK